MTLFLKVSKKQKKLYEAMKDKQPNIIIRTESDIRRAVAQAHLERVVEETGEYCPGDVVTSGKFVPKSGISTFDAKTGKTRGSKNYW